MANFKDSANMNGLMEAHIQVCFTSDLSMGRESTKTLRGRYLTGIGVMVRETVKEL